MFFDYHRQHNIEIKVGRIFNTYGPNMRPDDGRVISNFIVQALRNENITIYGDGLQTRSFSYVEDTVSGIISLMNSTEYDVFNIGNPNEMTVGQLAEKIIELTHSSSEIKYLDLPNDDPKQRKPDITKAKTKLDWEPKVNLEEGLTKTITWVEQQLSR